MKTKFKIWDTSEHLETDEDIKLYLQEAFKDGDPRLVQVCLRNALKAKNMTKLAKDIGVSRPGLYKMLSENGNPEFSNIFKILKALNLELTIR